MRRFALTAIVLLVAFGCANLHVDAQESSDERVMRFLKDQTPRGADGAGLVFVGTTILQNTLIRNKERCFANQVSVGQVIDGKYRAIPPIQGMHRFLGTQKNYGPVAMKAGEYYVGWVKCQLRIGSTGGTTFKGPHAKFRVNARKLIDVGSLRLEYELENFITGRGRTRTAVDPTDPERLAEAKKTMPVAMKKLVRRTMVLIGANERKATSGAF